VSLLEMDFAFIGLLCKRTGAVAVVPEYSLAPELPFPHALNEIEYMYRWVVGGGLGFVPSRLVLVGESAGGNLMTSLCIRLVKAKYISQAEPDLLMPTGLCMAYPALNLALSPSPSRSLHMCDPMLAYGVLHTCCKAYVPPGKDATVDCEISPAFTPGEVLRHFPPCALMGGGMDPLLDDAVDFFVQLRRSKVKSKMSVFRNLPHGFWSLGDFLPDANTAVNTAIEWVGEMCHSEHPFEEGDGDAMEC